MDRYLFISIPMDPDLFISIPMDPDLFISIPMDLDLVGHRKCLFGSETLAATSTLSTGNSNFAACGLVRY
jgi:hypothetical protein